MLVATPIINFPSNPGFKDAKWPSVTEAWNYFFGNTGYLEKHRGLDDAKIEAKIVNELYRLGAIRFNDLETKEKRVLKPYLDKSGWGYKDNQGNIVVEGKYTWADEFFEGMARIRVGLKWGFINENCEEVISPQFYDANRFSDGLSKVDYSAFIDKKGCIVIDKYSEAISDFSEGLAVVRKYSTSPPYTHGYINKKGEIVIPFKYLWVDDFSEGLAAVCLPDPNNNYNGYEFNFIQEIQEGDMYHKKERWGYIDTNGKLIISGKFFSAGSFKDGIALVEDPGLGNTNAAFSYKMYINKNGDDLTHGYQTPSEGLLLKRCREGKEIDLYGFINYEGKIIIPYNYEIARSFSEGLAAVCKNSKFGYINKYGAIVIELQYDKALSFSEGLAGVALTTEGRETWGFINKLGEMVISPKYRDVKPFMHSVSLVEPRNDKKHYIDKLGNSIINVTYEELGDCKEGIIPFRQNKKWAFFNTMGKQLTSFSYDDEGVISYKRVIVKRNGHFGLINDFGEEITPVKYNILREFNNGLARFQIDERVGMIDKKEGFVDYFGNEYW